MVIGTPTVLNLIPGGVMKVIHVNQVNKNIQIQFRIMNGAQPFNVPEGVSCTIRGTKGDNFGYAAAVAVTAGSNIVTVTLTEQLTAVAGAGNVFELIFVGASNNMRVSTENFILAVECAAMGEDTVISDSDLDYANQVLDQLQSVGAVNAQVQQNKANITAEVTRAKAAEQTLQSNINAEAAARQAADNTLQSNINAEAYSRATTDASLQSQINQMVVPSGSAPSAAEVENARIGADGTTYPTLGDAIRGQVSDVKSAIEESFEIYPSLRPTLSAGYINAISNAIESSDAFAVTAPIAVKKGQIVKLTATGERTVVGMIATCNADNTSRTTKVRSIDSTEHTYTYTVEEDGYVVCSVKTLYDTKYALSIIMNYYGLFDDVTMYGDILQIVSAGTVDKPIERYISGSYVFADGTVQPLTSGFISQSIDLYPGQTLTFNGRGYNRAVAMISEYDPASNTYTPLVLSVDSTDRSYTYIALEKMTVRCSAIFYASGQDVPYSATITTPDTDSIRISTLENKVNAISSEVIQYPQLFDNIVCIGDSLTVGYDGSGDTPLVKNYPHFMEKLTDANTTLKAHGGWTAKQIWDGEISTATDLANYDCAIIFLGTNGGLTDTVSTDCKTDYTQNADTNTGCYGKIIGKIKAVAPNCKIFCVAGVNDYVRRASTMNPAVRALAEFYSVGLIDVENCIMSDSGSATSAERYLYRPVDGIHYNALGYMTLANMFYDSMSAFIGEHRSMYA